MTKFHSIHLRIFVISDEEKKRGQETSKFLCLVLVFESIGVRERGGD